MLSTIDYRFLLAAATGIYCLLVFMIWQRSRNLAFPLGFFFLYYWTLSGAWDLVGDLSGGESGKRYHYLFDKLFPIELNSDYFLALIYYSLFLITIALVVLLVLSGKDDPRSQNRERVGDGLEISWVRVFVGSILCLAAALFIVRNQLMEAVAMNMSGYKVTAGAEHTDGLFRLHQSFNNLMVIPPAIGIPAFLAGREGRFLVSERSIRGGIAYGLLILILLLYAMVMGNKHELFTGLVTGVVLYLVNTPRPRMLRLAVGGLLAFMGIIAIDYTRSLSIKELSSGVDYSGFLGSFNQILSSNEGFSAHFSMYGVLHYQVPLTWGSSFGSLLASGIPRLLWANRPESVYYHYAATVGAAPDQGYTIHHATGWYLNFGLPGVLLGALTLGAIWVGLFRQTRTGKIYRSVILTAFPAVGFAFFTGGIPGLVRGGIESYKAVILYSFLAPLLVLVLGRVRKKGPFRS